MRRVHGFTLTELLVALVISALAAIAIYGAFSSLLSVSSQTRAQGNAWQQARTALAMLSDAIEGAGYGLPLNNCAQGIYVGIPPTQPAQNGAPSPTVADPTINGNTLVTPVAAVQQTNALYGYNPENISGFNAGVHTDALTVVTGGGNYATTPATQITQVSSVDAANFFVSSTAPFSVGDMTLVVLPDASCLMGQVTGPNNLGNGANNVVENAGQGANASAFNVPNGFAGVDPAVTAAALANAGVIDLGNQGFSIDTFYIADAGGSAVPSLYMQQIQAADSAQAPLPQLLARGVVDMRVQFGYGTQGALIGYAAPGAAPAADVLAVRLQLLVRDTRPSPGAVPDGPNGVPAIALMGMSTANPLVTHVNAAPTTVYYAVPTQLPAAAATGCVAGNCARYLYHVFDLVIPVRNDIWNQ
ncbi:MAG: PilW family protein [Gammaproteobacteria bacterium]|nr:PilW family protein [Gammaproteobacteria bacterium]